MDLSTLFGPENAPGQTVEFRLFPRRGADRWLLESRHRCPWHLETWPQANMRALIIYRAARLLGVFGLHLPSRRMKVTVSSGSLYEQLSERFNALGVFLGTPGPNRKVVIFAKEGDKTWFIKVPISARTKSLAENEAATLMAMAADADLAPLVPRCVWIDDVLAIEDVRAAGVRFAPLDEAEVLRVHDLLFARSRTTIPLALLKQRWTVERPNSRRHADPVTAQKIAAARQAAHRFIDTMPRAILVDCYEAHGDFTRWNVMRASDGTARIIDWELFGERPRLFDPFHYLVSQAILVNRTPASDILAQARRMVAGSLDGPSIALYFGTYIATQIFYYSKIFEKQDILHTQAHWQLETWTRLLEELAGPNRIGDRR